jgi:hypothetical protein
MILGLTMKNKFFICAVFFAAVWAAQAQGVQGAVEVSFVFTRQSGAASNQYAVWIEDAAGAVVKTLYATRYTADGGWKVRAQSIPLWVKKSGVAVMRKEAVDAITSATPRTGKTFYVWDGCDAAGKKLPKGEYRVLIEGSLRWGGRVVYEAVIHENSSGEIAPNARYYDGDKELSSGAPPEKNMISAVSVSVQ